MLKQILRQNFIAFKKRLNYLMTQDMAKTAQAMMAWQVLAYLSLGKSFSVV